MSEEGKPRQAARLKMVADVMKALEYEAAFEDAGFVAFEVLPKEEGGKMMEKRAVVNTDMEKQASRKLEEENAKRKKEEARSSGERRESNSGPKESPK